MSSYDKKIDRDRRRLLAGATAAGLAGLAAGARAPQAGAQQTGSTGSDSADMAPDPHAEISVARRGRYETAPLRQGSIGIAAVQSRVKTLDLGNLKGLEILGAVERPQGDVGAPLAFKRRLLERKRAKGTLRPDAILADLDGDGLTEAVLYDDTLLYVIRPRRAP